MSKINPYYKYSHNLSDEQIATMDADNALDEYKEAKIEEAIEKFYDKENKDSEEIKNEKG